MNKRPHIENLITTNIEDLRCPFCMYPFQELRERKDEIVVSIFCARKVLQIECKLCLRKLKLVSELVSQYTLSILDDQAT